LAVTASADIIGGVLAKSRRNYFNHLNSAGYSTPVKWVTIGAFPTWYLLTQFNSHACEVAALIEKAAMTAN
jgi:hypothetical protein